MRANIVSVFSLRSLWLFSPAVGLIPLLQPVPAAAQADLRFGSMTHFAQGDNPAWAGTVSQLAIPTVRDELYWNQVESTRGIYSFPAFFDTYMAALRQNNISPFIVLDFENPNYDADNTPYDADGFTGYANYAKAVLQHYGSQIQAVEIWNEYNGTWCTGPATNDRPGTYTKMLQQAYAAIKSARPDVIVAGGATAGIALGYWEQLMQDGALSSMDVLSVHPYRYNSAPEGIEQDIASLQALVRQYNNGVSKPIWASEIGWQIQTGTDGNLAIDETTQAEYLVRAYALLLSAGVQRIYWYDFSDDPGLSTMGLADSNGVPRMSGYAYQNTIKELSNATFVQREASATGLYSILFTRANGTPVRAMWSLTPTSFDAGGVTKMVDMIGDSIPVTGSVSLSGSPIFVEGPLTGLPPSSGESVLTDSQQAFSGIQGQNGWWYGDYSQGTAFETLGSYSNQVWSGAYPFITITPSDQHPSVNAGIAIPIVRRWVSTYAGNVHITGDFQAENTGGDGIGVTILVNGQPATVRTLIGSSSTVSQQNFDLVQTVQVGTTIDFAVDPGPSNNINFDATSVEATISTSQQTGTFSPTGGTYAAGVPPSISATNIGSLATSAPTTSSPSTTSAPPTTSTTTNSTPPAAGSVAADSGKDFSGTQGQNGWWYGDFASGTTFEELTGYSGGAWGSQYPFSSITQGDQHPSAWNNAPVSVVRRWVSTFAGTAQITGSFQMENTGGDGVGVTILVDGQPAMARTLLGTSSSAPTQQSFNLTQTVQVGSTIDFVVDPGSGDNINYDATAVNAAVTVAGASGTSTSSSTTSSTSSTSTSSNSSDPTSTNASDPSSSSDPAEPVTDFSTTQGQNGWSYGYFYGTPGAIGPDSGATFVPLTATGSSWTGPYPSLAITSTTLAPSVDAGVVQVSAVRRWTSTITGNAQVTGSFQIGHDGDGVGVTVMVDGQPVVQRALIGNPGPNFTQTFSFTQAVVPGTTIDFVVDPGPGRDYSSDATILSADVTATASGDPSSTPTTSSSTPSDSSSTASTSTSAPTASSSGTTTTSSPTGTSPTTTPVPAIAPVQANFSTDFSTTQGQNGWDYGYFYGTPGAIGPDDNATFTPMAASGSAWTGPYPSLGITSSSLFPSATAGIVQVSAVARWTSAVTGKVQVAGSFQVGHDGDGVGVTVMVNGQPVMQRGLIGNPGPNFTQTFSFTQAVAPGTTIDFVVDPGPGRDNNADSTTLSATIVTAP